MDNENLYKLIMAADYLGIQPLLNLCSAKIASLIQDKTVEEIRINLGIVNDFAPEEEAKVRSDNKWVEDLWVWSLRVFSEMLLIYILLQSKLIT